METAWLSYLDAAERKVAIGEYHVVRLIAELKGGRSQDGRPPIPIQAHFEGVVIAVMAAVDQVAQATNVACGLHLKPQELVSGAFERLGAEVATIREWFNDPLGLDLRQIRTRMAHYSYEKRPRRWCWVIEEANPRYLGTRELGPYARNALEYGRRLVGELPQIRRCLERGQAG
jgi:hypothetical protein